MTTAIESRDDAEVTRDKAVVLRLSAAEQKTWKEAANAAGLSLSEWIRRRVSGVVLEVPPPPKAKKGGR